MNHVKKALTWRVFGSPEILGNLWIQTGAHTARCKDRSCGFATLSAFLGPAPCLLISWPKWPTLLSSFVRAVDVSGLPPLDGTLVRTLTPRFFGFFSYQVVESLKKIFEEGLEHDGRRFKFILSEIRGDWKFQQVHCYPASVNLKTSTAMETL